MPILVSCDCGGKFRAKDELAGRQLKCPRCGNLLTIPQLRTSTVDVYEIDEPPPPQPPPARPKSNEISHVPPTIPLPPSPGHRLLENSFLRRWLYVGLVLAILPLCWSTFVSHRATLKERLLGTLKAHPDVRRTIEDREEQGTLSDRALFDLLPGHRVDGAWLARDSSAHWFYALLAAGAFFGLALLMLPATSTKPMHVFLTGLFTGTAGVLLLLGVQFIAHMMRGHIFIPRSIIGLFFLVLKGIQLSYDAADDPRNNFFLSALGFTFGVGLCEELCKALPLLWHYRLKAHLDWRGACLWGFLSGVGFGISEAIMYSARYYNGITDGEMYLVRFISCVALHGVWAASAGIFIYRFQGLIQNAEKWYEVLYNSALLVAIPMVLHGFYDTMLKKDMHAAALGVAVLSFGWFIFLVEWMRKQEEPEGAAAFA